VHRNVHTGRGIKMNNNFTRYVNPHLGEMLESIKLDQKYIRGVGCYLYDEKGNSYLDCIAAYGALPFGHNPVEIWEAIDAYRQSSEPGFIQPSALDAAGELAGRLVKLAPNGLEYVTFSNSGAEAVEASLKMCRSATGRPGILPSVRYQLPAIPVINLHSSPRRSIFIIFPMEIVKRWKKPSRRDLTTLLLLLLSRFRVKAVLSNHLLAT